MSLNLRAFFIVKSLSASSYYQIFAACRIHCRDLGGPYLPGLRRQGDGGARLARDSQLHFLYAGGDITLQEWGTVMCRECYQI